MVSIGIDVAKDKHDCCILDSKGQAVRETFTFKNNHEGFEQLRIETQKASKAEGSGQIKAGLEATGHYSCTLEAFLRNSGLELVVLNPLQVSLFRKSQTLRKTKTDKVDAQCIAKLLMSAESNSVSASYQIQELKALTRHRFRLISQQTKIKQSIARLVVILFPELPSVCTSVTRPL